MSVDAIVAEMARRMRDWIAEWEDRRDRRTEAPGCWAQEPDAVVQGIGAIPPWVDLA